jgi:hypothetical protein
MNKLRGFYCLFILNKSNTMTISRRKLPKVTKYNADKNPPPKFISIGVSLITVETYTIIQDDRAVVIPVDDDVVYLTVPFSVVNLPCGGASYDIIADILDSEHGYLKKHWRIMSVWSCVPSHKANEIF